MAENFHPSEFIQEELDAREWSLDDLARRMGGDFASDRLALNMYMTVGPNEPNLRLGDMAGSIARAFAVNEQFFESLETSWLSRVAGRYSDEVTRAWKAEADADRLRAALRHLVDLLDHDGSVPATPEHAVALSVARAAIRSCNPEPNTNT